MEGGTLDGTAVCSWQDAKTCLKLQERKSVKKRQGSERESVYSTHSLTCINNWGEVDLFTHPAAALLWVLHLGFEQILQLLPLSPIK